MAGKRKILTCTHLDLDLCRRMLEGLYSYQPKGADWHLIRAGWQGIGNGIDWSEFSGFIGFFSTPESLAVVPHTKIPCVNVSSRQASLPIPSVYGDNYKIGELAAEHLLGIGLRRFAFVGLGDVYLSQMRFAGFASTLEKAGHSPAILRDSNWNEILNSIPRPYGLFAATDNMAANVMEHCEALGLRIPEDVAIIGCDNDHVVNIAARVPLSSIDPNGRQIGYLAARTLEALMNGESVPHVTLVPPIGVETRRSTDMLALEDEELAAAVRYIREHCSQPIRIDHICDQIRISRRTLELRFRRQFNRTVHDEILRVRIERAKQLLVQTDMTVEDVCARSGFRYRNRFNAAFKAHVGQQPLEYRKQHRLR